jgi:hypothetical protein
VLAVPADAFDDDGSDLPFVEESDVAVDVSGEFFGDVDLVAMHEPLGEGVDFGATVRGAVAVLVVDALEGFDEREPGEAAVVRPPVVPVLRADVGETTPGAKFTLATMSCAGNCAVSPTVLIGRDLYGRVLPSQVESMLERYR